ncbi:hypothetical protein [Desulforamulus ferrireducens]|uniref:Lipoprotein n=1 Tax=Desulforamulus ferrireducens TaxID=1833852 RepID=A0A1S6IZY6_9FIRM|nr:hypothetical protein [Desulforamulus ferrireducens]AQS60335.1 hypothetical protein B0537_15420 [Desulforamulus ferrireducens]
MKNKKLVLLISIIILSLVAVGCGGGKTKNEVLTPEQAAVMEGDPLKNLITKEKEWLNQMDKVRDEIKNAYTDWEQGKITREQFNERLNGPKEIVKGVFKDYDLHMEVNPFPEELKRQELYKDGLVNGKELRKFVNNFIFMAQDGIMDAETKTIKYLTDEQVKDVYQNFMVEKYDEYKQKLETALEKEVK